MTRILYHKIMKKSRAKKITLPPIMQTDSARYTCKVYLYHDDAKGSVYKSITADTYDDCLDQAMEIKKQSKQERAQSREEKIEKRAHRTVSDAVGDYIAVKSNVLSPSTVVGYKRILTNYIKPIAEYEAARLSSADVQRWINQLAAVQSPKTVSNSWGLLSSTMRMFYPKMQFAVTLPQKEKNEVQIPTKAEIDALFEYVKGDLMELPIYLAACCGMRRSEIAALRWKNVDLSAGTIHVCEARVKGENGEVVKGTKTRAGDRTIKLYPFIAELLKSRQGAPSASVCGLSAESISNRYDTIKRACGFPYNFHALRHYCVSVMLSLNIPKNYIADYVGHETENMIDQVYGHIMRDKKSEVEALLQSYFSN